MSGLQLNRLSRSPVDEQVGNQLRFCRTRAGLSVAELAGTLGVASEQVEHWEQGKTRIPAEQVLASTKALGVNPSALFSDLD